MSATAGTCNDKKSILVFENWPGYGTLFEPPIRVRIDGSRALEGAVVVRTGPVAARDPSACARDTLPNPFPQPAAVERARVGQRDLEAIALSSATASSKS